MKKILALVLSLAMMLGLASCAKKVEVPSKSDVKKAAKEEYDMDFKVDSEDISDDEKDAEWVLISKDGTLQVTVTWNAKKPEEFEFDDEELEEPTTTTTTEEPTTTTTEEPTTTTTTEASTPESSDNGGSTPNPNPSGAKYVNFDDMSFYLNGKKYTLGKSTLQDLIDDGVKFEEDDLENAKNNIKSHYQSSYFKIDPGVKNGCFIWIQVFNETDSGKPANECYINEILYKVLSDEGAKQKVITFDFPLNLTLDELKANSGEPNEKPYHNEDNPKYIYDTLEWTKKGTKFWNSNRISFRFTNGALKEVSMTYIP